MKPTFWKQLTATITVGCAIFLSLSSADAAPKMARDNSECLELFKQFVFAKAPKAFALSYLVKTERRSGVQGCGSAWGAQSQDAARRTAINHCKVELKEFPKVASTCQVVQLKYVIKGPPPRQAVTVKKNWR